MSTLPEPDFIGRDPLQIEQELIAGWEAMTGLPVLDGKLYRLMFFLLD